MLSAIITTHPSPRNHRYVVKFIAKEICRYSIYRKLDPYMVLSVIRHESYFNPRLKNKTNDYGLMQINKKWSRAKCNLRRIRCNIREGTRMMSMWRRACLLHKYKDTPWSKHENVHWLRHYNWNNKRHHLKILWLTEAYKKAAEGHRHLYKIIKDRRFYRRLNINYNCIKEDLCGTL
jgi:hypothetical protein